MFNISNIGHNNSSPANTRSTVDTSRQATTVSNLDNRVDDVTPPEGLINIVDKPSIPTDLSMNQLGTSDGHPSKPLVDFTDNSTAGFPELDSSMELGRDTSTPSLELDDTPKVESSEPTFTEVMPNGTPLVSITPNDMLE